MLHIFTTGPPLTSHEAKSRKKCWKLRIYIHCTLAMFSMRIHHHALEREKAIKEQSRGFFQGNFAVYTAVQYKQFIHEQLKSCCGRIQN